MSPMIAIALTLAAGAPAPQTTPAQVAEVVVYLDRAVVTRRLSVPCTGSVTTVTFARIPPAADPASFRPEVRGGNIESMRWVERARAGAFSPKLSALDERLRRLAVDVTAAEAELARITAGAESGEAYREITEQLVTKQLASSRPNLATWRRALDTVRDTGLLAARARTPVDARLRALGREQATLLAEREVLVAGSERKEYQADVEVACPAGAQASL